MSEDGGTGLRERKRLRTHQAISEAAIRLFLERGFDQVSVAEIAAAAEVSKPTLFKYFPTKEDLVLERFVDHIDEQARVVAGRPKGQSAIAALRAHFLAALAARDVTVGLDDREQTLTFQRLFFANPSLLRRAQERTSSEHGLAEAFRAELRAGADDLGARVAAAQIEAVTQLLVLDNLTRLLAGERAEDVYPDAVAAANRAFDLLADGLGDYPQ
ncbi:MAG TPA: TetR family transcriptional regulator [Pseudonocardiaceae bacterium]|jgi:AcrR family transcriptional regulator|nr:TetR family transcriptional regulator [Pseudonocardiaceae bacterium]